MNLLTRSSRASLVVCVCSAAISVAYLHLHAQADRTQGTLTSQRIQSASLQTPPTGHPSPAPVLARAVLDKYCVACHNQRLKTAGLQLDTLALDRIGADAETWEKVARKLRTHEMPPPGRPRPDLETYGTLVNWLEGALDAAAAAKLNPGRVVPHRLNRTEYTNAIRDLLGLEVDGRALLSEDEPAQESFDNIASVLSMSPALLESYLSAARKVSRLAMGDPTIEPLVDTYKVPNELVQDGRTNDDLPFGSRGGMVFSHHFPLDGEYSIKVRLRRELYDYLIGMGEPHQLDVRLDGVLLKRFNVGGEGKGMTAPESFIGNTSGDPEWETYMQTADAGLELRTPVKAGTREVAVSFVRRYWHPEGVLQPPQRHFARTTNEDYFGNPQLDAVFIGGPYQGVRSAETAVQRRIFVCTPANAAAEEPCARRILSTLAQRAYRRPLVEKDVERLLAFYRAGRAAGGFEAGIQSGIERMLTAPSFLFRVEQEPANLAVGSVYRVSDLDLASRLSFFLWSSIPDAELLDLAMRGRLANQSVLDQQVRRMLRDPRARVLATNFGGQWLNLGKLGGVVPDGYEFPDFDENLRQAMRQETELFIDSQIREDRSVIDLLTADYTFINDRLAAHYGIPNVYGSHFRRAPVEARRRGGILGHASVLTITSYPTRTSPVVRGKWLLDNLLGSPPPPPPPDVPALQENAEGAPLLSVRQRMEAHRKNPVCATCHVRMDPLGFSLENFDALGQWRTMAEGVPIDTAASFPDGTKFDGLAGLRTLMVAHKDEFARTLTEKLLAYAIGRGIEHHDLPAVRAITKAASAGDYRWSALIAGVVKSVPFSMGMVHDPQEPAMEVAVK
jgi:hypothetical protein